MPEPTGLTAVVGKLRRYLDVLRSLAASAHQDPAVFRQALKAVPSVCKAIAFSRAYQTAVGIAEVAPDPRANPLWDFFQNRHAGPGIWKWQHYFDIYHRHLGRFVDTQVNVLEIGIYSGGSLSMWRSYFGDGCHVYGVDIEEACRLYESEHVTVEIGDQQDRTFWAGFRQRFPRIDVLVDDGGHTPEQQRITLEEMLPHLHVGGVYICEDIHGRTNEFASYAAGLVDELNSINADRSHFRASLHSIHFYPFMLVIEKHDHPHAALTSLERGTEWQPFARESWT